ncbi:hypothetical protein Kpol_1011p8 [Vanderwaltozyma polyspora DSM 70294]|uniref:Uncharacterized protein n=1 Tax=Vanderwaltozyma polyspora (strain ATCC 22028 / DSM 70294 / BCRC 21397 / CBS 2163 / NBRC 10782 / NRRL Y-8283 / UCD 57-17) TaxID=436907 RepID=A7TQW5_VANPO|nr:uncharacterized protein Kpol_1011p8 [Vanderwaltozyma polyspora DSM 70294]EDO15338.1 hypothetical protein Kpol_1011p8 [Vanderwaltozyma polyspora DSM 70294]
MDFTSESDLGSDLESDKQVNTSNSQLIQEEQEQKQEQEQEQENEDDFLSKEDTQRLHLQELKEDLLSKRNELIKEIDTYKKEISTRQKNLLNEQSLLDQNASNLLRDLLIASSTLNSNSNLSNDGPNDIDDNRKAKTQFIDGASPLQIELLSKYDTLPLLNMDLRIRYLEEYLYPNVNVEIVSEELENIDVTNTTIKVYWKFTKIELILNLSYDTTLQILLKFDILSISENYKLKLMPLIDSCKDNPTLLLFFTNQYDKLLQKRNSIFKELQDTFQRQLKSCNIVNNQESLVLTNIMKGSDDLRKTIKLQIDFNIQFSIDSKFTLPTSKINSKLWSDHNLILVNDNTILYGLIKEYGVLQGLKEYTKTCLFPKSYS